MNLRNIRIDKSLRHGNNGIIAKIRYTLINLF